jgi:hypothetical protein
MEHDNCVAGSGRSTELDDVEVNSITCFQIPVSSSVRKMLPGDR